MYQRNAVQVRKIQHRCACAIHRNISTGTPPKVPNYKDLSGDHLGSVRAERGVVHECLGSFAA